MSSALRELVQLSFFSSRLSEAGEGPSGKNPIVDIAEELREFPEFQDVTAFVESKLEDDDHEFSTAELVALALNRMGPNARVPSKSVTSAIKDELVGLGLVFTGAMPKSRGVSSPETRRQEILTRVGAPQRIDALPKRSEYDPGIPAYPGTFEGQEVSFQVPVWRLVFYMKTDPTQPRLSVADSALLRSRTPFSDLGRKKVASYAEGKYIWRGNQWIKRMPSFNKTMRPRVIESTQREEGAD